jgi:hypothetical protein
VLQLYTIIHNKDQHLTHHCKNERHLYNCRAHRNFIYAISCENNTTFLYSIHCKCCTYTIKGAPRQRLPNIRMKWILNNIASLQLLQDCPKQTPTIIRALFYVYIILILFYNLLYFIFQYIILINKCKRDHVILKRCELYITPLLSYTLKMAS